MVRKRVNNINHRMDSEADPTKTALQVQTQIMLPTEATKPTQALGSLQPILKKFIIMKEGFI
jgi:hypothetical protein